MICKNEDPIKNVVPSLVVAHFLTLCRPFLFPSPTPSTVGRHTRLYILEKTNIYQLLDDDESRILQKQHSITQLRDFHVSNFSHLCFKNGCFATNPSHATLKYQVIASSIRNLVQFYGKVHLKI